MDVVNAAIDNVWATSEHIIIGPDFSDITSDEETPGSDVNKVHIKTDATATTVAGRWYDRVRDINGSVLDLTSNAIAAYSLRKLSWDYSGNAIRVRRDNDDAEQDIGFATNSDQLDTAGLLSFTGSNSAYVVTWYDQSGNGRHATNSDSAEQPRIVNSGAIETIDGFNSIHWHDSGKFLVYTGSLGLTSKVMAIAPIAITSGSPQYSRIITLYKTGDSTDFNGSTSAQLVGSHSPSNYLRGFNYPYNAITTYDQLSLLGSHKDGSSNNFYLDGELVNSAESSSVLDLSNTTNIVIGAGGTPSGVGNTLSMEGYIPELVILNTGSDAAMDEIKQAYNL